MAPKTPTLAAVIRRAVEDRLADVHIMLPGRVEKYDAASQKADVQPLIKRFQEGGNGSAISETYPVIPSVPVAFPRVGEFAITFPVARGDLVTLHFCEASIDAHQIGAGRDPVSPDLFQRFDLTDAVATPGWYPDAKALASTDPDNIVIGKDGTESDFVALAQKVLDELSVVKANTEAAISYTTSLGAVFAAGVPIPTDGGAALQIAWNTAIGLLSAPVPTDPNSVAAQKVKVT